MKKSVVLLLLAMAIGSTAEKCGSEVNPENPTMGCFADSPLETIAWAKEQLAFWQRPKSGPLQVIVYLYKGEEFLAFENMFDNGPASHIFDCAGSTLGKRAINYNEFYRSNKKVKLLLEGIY